MLCLFSCSGETGLVETGDRLVDEKNEVSFVLCSPSLQAKAIKGAVTSYGDITLYEVAGLPTDEFLSENFEGIGGLYRSEKAEEPDLESFGATGASVCHTAGSTFECATIGSQDVIDKIVDLIRNGESTIQPANVDSTWQIKLVGDKYPSLYYNISAIRSISGKTFLYDKSLRRCVETDGFLDEYLK